MLKVSDIKTVLILEQVRAIVDDTCHCKCGGWKITSLTLDSYEDDQVLYGKGKLKSFLQ